MKKVMLNNSIELAVLLFIAIAWSFFMVLPIYFNADTSAVIGVMVLGGVNLVCVIPLILFNAELIVFYEDRIVSSKLFRRVEICYDEIVDIKETRVGLSDEKAWQIIANSNRVINVTKRGLITTKKRKKLMEYIFQKSSINIKAQTS